ncbi:MAG: hypothetical protein LBI14_05595 [Treponema sp.]|jgi:hypothetical protein|nr:hypothetical protein [Treponema sp.]
MRRAWFFLFFLFLLIYPLAAQEEEPEDEFPDIIWDIYVPDVYRAGDMMFHITAGTIFPTIFTGSGIERNNHGINTIGGIGALAYSYFLTPNWFIGGELRGMFIGTRAKNMLFIVPIGPYVGFQFTAGRFEFPIRLMVGIAPQLYTEDGYFGMIINPGVSVYYRFNPDWSFGLNLQWWMVPQWPKSGKNVLGNFLEISLSARYHFQ